MDENRKIWKRVCYQLDKKRKLNVDRQMFIKYSFFPINIFFFSLNISHRFSFRFERRETWITYNQIERCWMPMNIYCTCKLSIVVHCTFWELNEKWWNYSWCNQYFYWKIEHLPFVKTVKKLCTMNQYPVANIYYGHPYHLYVCLGKKKRKSIHFWLFDTHLCWKIRFHFSSFRVFFSPFANEYVERIEKYSIWFIQHKSFGCNNLQFKTIETNLLCIVYRVIWILNRNMISPNY